MEDLNECKGETFPEINPKEGIKTNPDSNLINDNQINIISNIDSSSQIENIFYIDTNQEPPQSFPKINPDNFKIIIDIFNKGIIPNFDDKEELFQFINDKIKVIKKLQKIIKNRYEILDIIVKLCQQNNFSLLEFFIDLYFKALEALHSENPVSDILDNNLLNNEIICKIEDTINWIISCGSIKKKNYDYIFQKLADLQLSKKLNNFQFCEYLNLIEVFYGKKYDEKYIDQLIAKNYVYFYDKKNSGITTNISDRNIIEIKEGISILLWFYLTDSIDDDEQILVEMLINDYQFEIILDKNNDIIIKNKGSLLKNKDNNVFNIPRLKWIQLRIQLFEKYFKLSLYKGDSKELIKNNKSSLSKTNVINKYETKSYIFDNNKNQNMKIKSLTLFKNYLGYVGTIIFCTSKELSDNVILSDYGIDDCKIYNFLVESPIFGNYFIFSPVFYVKEKEKFIDSTNNVSGKINNNSTNNIEFNGVFKYRNFIKSIYSLGGIENILPLFEMFYKFTINKGHENDEVFFHLIFKKLIKILELIFINKKNYVEVLGINDPTHNNVFIQSLSLFLEMIDEKYYKKDDDIINSFLKIGRYIYVNFFNQTKYEKNYYFFNYILFSPKILIKFSLAQQEMLWKFFDQGNNQNPKVKLPDFRKCFMSFEQMIKFFLSLSNKYNKEKKEVDLLTNSLMNIIKVIIQDKSTKSYDRESLFLLISYNKLNESIIRGIIEIFNSFLDVKDINSKTQNEENNINLNNKEKNYTNYNKVQRIEFVNTILSPNNNTNFEILLKLFASKNRATKKVIINFIQTLFLKYGDIVENYFSIIDQSLSKGKNIKKVCRKDFYHFIEEYIAFNYFFRRIPPDDPSKNKENEKVNLINDKQNISQINNIIPINIEKEENEPNKKRKRNISMDFNYIRNNKNGKKLNLLYINVENDGKDSKEKKDRHLSFNKNDIKKNTINKKKLENIESMTTNIKSQEIDYLKEKNIHIFRVVFEDDKIAMVESDSKHILQNIKVNNNICKILFDLLQNYHSPNKSSETQDNLMNNVIIKSFFEKTTKNKTNIKTNSFDEEKIINILIKFLENTKELEVICSILVLLKGAQAKKDNNYYHLLDLFSFTNTDFLQLIEELLIISFLCPKDKDYKDKIIFVHLNNDITQFETNNEDDLDYFNSIYSNALTLLQDIYFYKNNPNKNKILNGLINLILLLSNNNNDINNNITLNLNCNENKTFNILLQFYEDFLGNINSLFYSKLHLIKNQVPNKNNEKSKSKTPSKESPPDNFYLANYTSIKAYFEFITFLFEYYLLKNHNIFIPDNYQKHKMTINAGFPEFFDLKREDNAIIYYNFVIIMKDLFNINKSLESMNNLNKKEKTIFNENNEIFCFDKDLISKIFNEYMSNKEYKNEIKIKIELFLMKNNNTQKTNFFTMIEIITFFNNYYIEKYLIDEKKYNSQTFFNAFFFLNYHQYFIINMILIACKIKENDVYITALNKSYQEIQDLFFTTLEYNINNIIKNCKTGKFMDYFAIIIINIFFVISIIYELYVEKTGKINYNKLYIKKLVEVYSSKYAPIFNKNNLIQFSKNSLQDNMRLFKDHSNKFVEQILFRNSNDITDKPTIDIFNMNKYIEIINLRKTEISSIKLLMNKNADFPDSKTIVNHQNLFDKINELVVPFENKSTLNDSVLNIKKRNNYRKLKKKLYSWNNSYSNLDVFYKNNREKLKFKISNFLSKDLSRRLLIPILDFDFNVPKFKTFDYKKKLFQNTSTNPDKNQYDDLYSIDLKIFNSKPEIFLPKMTSINFFIDEVCYIKTNHHINGLIFVSKSSTNSIFFASIHPRHREELINSSNYDSENKRCFGSIFSGEFSQKEKEIYFNLALSEINFIFIRRYCFRNNAFEIFTKNHRSYYFKFEDYKKRNQFLDNLINKVNKSSQNKRQIFKPIKGIDENDKPIIIGYYKDNEKNKPFSNISSILELWKNNKISTFEYLMWINIYGNRSYQDIGQYPIFPWIMINHENKRFDELISYSSNFRDLHLPIGMIAIDEKGKLRQEGYLDSYRIMIMELANQNLIKIKLKDEESIEETNNFEKSNSNVDTNKRIDRDKDNNNPTNKMIISLIYLTNQNVIPNYDKSNEKHQKLFDFNLNLDKLYYNPNIDYDLLPYVFGSLPSNAMYVSHYLCRLFPYSFSAIEIQNIGFDCPDRLFINLQNAVNSSITEKGDLREIIPDFFILPELFININRLDLGKKNEKYVEDVKMPSWCLDNPFLFVENYRALLECGYLNINSWIDLVFGHYQRGKSAQAIGNIFLPFAYDGVMNFRLPPEVLLKTREENEFKIRLFEMGVIPTKVFEKKIKSSKNQMNEQITLLSDDEIDISEILHEVELVTKFKNIIYFSIKKSLLEEIYVLDKRYLEQKLIIQENREEMNYSVKEISSKKPFPFSKYIQRNIEYKLIVKQIFKNEIYIIAGLFDGELHIFKNTNKLEYNDDNYEYNFDKSIHTFDKSLITALAIDKEERYIIYGTQKGTLVIYHLKYEIYKETGDKFIILHRFFPSHPDFAINYICINSDLNLFADCAYDGYVHIYNLPKCDLVRSIFIDPHAQNNIFNLDFVFLSAQPMASVAVYSNGLNNFKSFSLNGNELFNKSQNNNKMSLENITASINVDLSGMMSPIMFTDSHFNDYVLYILNNKIITINKFPSMQIIAFINPRLNKEIYLTNLCISTDLKSIYVYDELNNLIYIIHQNIYKNGH